MIKKRYQKQLSPILNNEHTIGDNKKSAQFCVSKYEILLNYSIIKEMNKKCPDQDRPGIFYFLPKWQ